MENKICLSGSQPMWQLWDPGRELYKSVGVPNEWRYSKRKGWGAAGELVGLLNKYTIEHNLTVKKNKICVKLKMMILSEVT